MDFIVKFNCRANYIVFEASYSFRQGLRQISEIPLKHIAKDFVERLNIEGLNVKQIKVPNISHSDNITASDWWQHSSNKVDST